MSAAVLPTACDVAVIGAGPAGLAAASVCARAGLSTVLLDENAGPGGQIYRSVAASPLRDRGVLGDDYWSGTALVEEMRTSGARHVAGATVWALSRDRQISASIAGRSAIMTARRVVLATGALERPFPMPGWTLPGVMTVGAAQTALKSSGLVADGPVVIAGCGPLLWLLAAQYLKAGKVVDAILDTTPRRNWRAALPHLPGFLASPYLAKGLRLVRQVRARIRIVSGVTALCAEGERRLAAVSWRTGSAREERLPVETLLLHQGVVPNVNMAMSIGIEHRWDDAQACFSPVLGPDGATALPGIAMAGDGTGIGGAAAAEAQGRLAALAAVRDLAPNRPGLEAQQAQARRRLATALRGRAFLDALYRAPDAFRRPEGETIVCRCEEITARQVTDAVALGCVGPNQAKFFLRAGMGPCQGRLCGLTVSELIAHARGVSPAATGYYRLRPPVKPITLAELASLPHTAAALEAVERD